MSSIAELESQLQEWEQQLEMINEQLATEPDNDEFLALKDEVTNGIKEYQVELAKLQPKAKAPESQPPPPPSSAAASAHAPTGSPEKYQTGYGSYTGGKTQHGSNAAPPPPAPKVYRVNEKVLAYFKGKLQNAKVIAVSGSQRDPKITVKFDNLPDTPTLDVSALKPIAAPPASHSLKRKVDDVPPPPSTTIFAEPNVNTELAQAKKEHSKATDGPTKPRKVAKKLKNNKIYEKNANDWKAFSSKMSSKGKMGKKDSMFRTGDSFNARVGFTGSGKPMTDDPTRTKHRYDYSAAVEDDDE